MCYVIQRRTEYRGLALPDRSPDRLRSYLTQVADTFGIEIVDIVQHPMDGLVKYHCITVPVNN